MYLIDKKIDRVPLPSGSVLICIPLDRTQSVTIISVVTAGPRYDFVGREGLAHLVEHIKTQKKGDGDRSEIQGFTYLETVRYWISCLPQDLYTNTHMLLRSLQKDEYSIKAIETEKKRVLEEMSIIQANPQKQIWELWTTLIFSNTPLGRGYIGTGKSVSRIKRKDVREHITRYYVPKNLFVILSGRIEKQEKEKTIESILSLTSLQNFPLGGEPLERNEHERSFYLGRENITYHTAVQQRDTPALSLICGFSTGKLTNKEYIVLQILGLYLVRNNGGVLSRQLFSKFGVYVIQTTTMRLSDSGYFSFYFSVSYEIAVHILPIIYAELKKAIDGDIEKDQVVNAKNAFVRNLITTHDSPETIARYYSHQYFLEKDHLLTQDATVTMCIRVTKKDLQTTAQNFFLGKNFKIAAIGRVQNDLPIFTI